MNGWGEEDKSDPVGEFLVGLGLTEQGTAHAGGEDSLLQIRTLLAPFVLRRVKTQVLKQLAPKTSHDLTLVPDARQKQIYDGILRRHIERVTQRKTAKKSGKAVDLNAMVGNQKECRNVFSELRKAANHPLLLREHFKDPKKMELMANRLYNTGFFGETCTIEVEKFSLFTSLFMLSFIDRPQSRFDFKNYKQPIDGAHRTQRLLRFGLAPDLC